ncbi:MAG: hypothetical protein Kow00105_12720 [Phycisphaeraceae bacterium]
MLDTNTLIILLVLAGLSYWLVTSVVGTLAARFSFEVRRHDLIVESKRLRLEYLNAYEHRAAGIIEDDEEDGLIHYDQAA